ncbi:hypothetical protein EVAR_57193_1 [Eumeta japonica]|uniref:Uncharacterized protein n=1 Tax=Eumeta variegata TaxID=151549 RepID=A0A4C1Z0K0_EUMVA|nr:hypothetical protein EVAR_57193_1 [Eumeta japonica]
MRVLTLARDTGRKNEVIWLCAAAVSLLLGRVGRRSGREIARSALSLARSAQAERDNESCFFLRCDNRRARLSVIVGDCWWRGFVSPFTYHSLHDVHQMRTLKLTCVDDSNKKKHNLNRRSSLEIKCTNSSVAAGPSLNLCAPAQSRVRALRRRASTVEMVNE